MMERLRPLCLVAGALFSFASCGSDSVPGTATESPLPPAAAEGREVFQDKGCAACHGGNAEGGVGPALVGLYGSEVELSDGQTVIADAAYLRESIDNPSAKIVEGYQVPMPSANLDADELDALIAYIEELGNR